MTKGPSTDAVEGPFGVSSGAELGLASVLEGVDQVGDLGVDLLEHGPVVLGVDGDLVDAGSRPGRGSSRGAARGP